MKVYTDLTIITGVNSIDQSIINRSTLHSSLRQKMTNISLSVRKASLGAIHLCELGQMGGCKRVCFFVCLSVFLFTCLCLYACVGLTVSSSTCLSVWLGIGLHVTGYLLHFFTCSSVCLFRHNSVCICLLARPSFCLPIYLLVNLSVCLFRCRFVCLSVNLSTWLSIYLFFRLYQCRIVSLWACLLLSTCLPACLSVCLCMSLCVNKKVCTLSRLSVYLLTCLSCRQSVSPCVCAAVGISSFPSTPPIPSRFLDRKSVV